MSGDPYVYPGTTVLRNRFDIRNAEDLDRLERLLVVQRVREGIPRGDFDLAHLKAIHKYLFQDVYDWAGEVRTIEISRSGHQFQFRRYIVSGMADVHQRVVDAGYFKDLSASEFAAEAGRIIGDVNYVHPFREGNGRTQLFYLKQLAEIAGHRVDLTRMQPALWLAASREAHQARYELMGGAIAQAIVPDKDRG